MHKLSLFITTILIFSGAAIAAEDIRQEISLNKIEREHLLSEMRLFLTSVQKITMGVAKEDMAIVTKAARESGFSAQKKVPTPKSLVNKLPLSFKKLGRNTHKKFDELALDAKDLGDPQHALQQLSSLMKNCVSCHSLYKIKLME